MKISIKDGIVNLSPDGTRTLRAHFSINPSDFVLLAGRNGSGKTSLLDVIASVRTLDAGTLSLEKPLEAIAYAVQDSYSGLVPWRTILQNILLPNLLVDRSFQSTRDLALSHLRAFGLETRAHDYPYKLSGGERQAINFIRTVCTPCSLALFDETLSSLHHNLRDIAKKILTKWVQGRTCIIVTHDPNDIDLPYTRFFIIDGDVVEEADRIAADRMLRNAL